MPATARPAIVYRPETEADQPFLMRLYASTREDEFAAVGWPAETLRAFLHSQHRAQDHHFRATYPDAVRWVVEQSGEPIGRLCYHDNKHALHLIDIALIPERRGAGIGSRMIGDLIDRAQRAGKGFSCFVDKRNIGAARLYRRLGLGPIEDHGLYDLMVRPAPKGGPRRAAD